MPPGAVQSFSSCWQMSAQSDCRSTQCPGVEGADTGMTDFEVNTAGVGPAALSVDAAELDTAPGSVIAGVFDAAYGGEASGGTGGKDSDVAGMLLAWLTGVWGVRLAVGVDLGAGDKATGCGLA